MCKFQKIFHRLKNLVRFFPDFFPLWTMKDDFCWYCLWFCLLCSFVLDYLQKEVKAKFNFAKLKESLKFLWSELKNLEKWSKKCTEEEGFLKSMQHALLVSIQGWLQTVVTSTYLNRPIFRKCENISPPGTYSRTMYKLELSYVGGKKTKTKT